MHYEDESRGFNVVAGFLFGALVGSGLALLSRAAGRIELRRPPSRRERVKRRLDAFGDEARKVVAEGARSVRRR
jgi:hypothetical protein